MSSTTDTSTTPTPRSNSISMTDATALSSLQSAMMMMDGSLTMDGSMTLHGSARRPPTTTSSDNMGRSLNCLNLEQQRRQTLSRHMKHNKTTVGGASPRLALMQLRLRRLKKTSPAERLYQSDSALFSSANATTATPTTKIEQHKGDVWFKSVHPKHQGAAVLEKLEEAEAEHEHSHSDIIMQDSPLGMSGTDLWLSPDAIFESNQSAPGYIMQPQELHKLSLREEEDDDNNAADDDDDDVVDHSRR